MYNNLDSARMTTNNRDFKMGWIDGYYPFSEYAIVGKNLVFSGDENYVEHNILTRGIVEKSISGYNQSGGGSVKDIKEFKINGKDLQEAFKILERKVDRHLKKNKNLGGKEIEGFEKIYLLSLKSLEGGKEKIFIKIYRKKNV